MCKWGKVLAVVLTVMTLKTAVFADCTTTQKIKQSFYSNMQNRILTKQRDITKARIRDKIEKLINYAILKNEKQVLQLKDAKGLVCQSDIQKLDNIIVGDMEYSNGIVCNKDNTITYDLKGKYEHFTAYVGVYDNKAPTLKDENINGVNLKLRYPVGKVCFSVFVDDVLVYFSSVMNGDSLPEYISVSVKNGEKLRLVVANLDHENDVKMAWINPTLYRNKIMHKPCEVSYKRQDGTFLYCNNPESITRYDTLNNGKIIYKETNVCGDINLFCEQNNSTNQDMYYAVVVKNNTDDIVTMVVENKGMSKNWWTGLKWNENCWKHYAKNVKRIVEIVPNDAAWLIAPTLVSQYNQYTGEGVVNLVVKFNVDMPVDVEVVAFNEGYENILPSQIDGRYEGYRIEHEHLWGEARNYKGKTNNYPCQECVLEWEIDDNTQSGYLPVRYGNIDRAGFISHITPNKHTSALGIDMYEFLDPNNICFSYNNVDYSTMIANLGNWAITYEDTIRIRNLGTCTRKVDIILKNAFLNNGVIVIKPDGTILKTGDARDNIKTVETVEVDGGETCEVSLIYLLPACSFGGLGHYVMLT